MSKKKTPVRVKIKRHDRKKQMFVYDIDDVGPGPDHGPRERFASSRNAWRSALRKLKAWKGTTAGDHKTPDGHPIVKVLA